MIGNFLAGAGLAIFMVFAGIGVVGFFTVLWFIHPVAAIAAFVVAVLGGVINVVN